MNTVSAFRLTKVAAWLSGNSVAHISKVTLRRARLVPGWVTVHNFCTSENSNEIVSVCR